MLNQRASNTKRFYSNKTSLDNDSRTALRDELLHRVTVLILAGCELVCWEREFYAQHKAKIDSTIARVLEDPTLVGNASYGAL
jgi:hypothetical protein